MLPCPAFTELAGLKDSTVQRCFLSCGCWTIWILGETNQTYRVILSVIHNALSPQLSPHNRDIWFTFSNAFSRKVRFSNCDLGYQNSQPIHKTKLNSLEKNLNKGCSTRQNKIWLSCWVKLISLLIANFTFGMKPFSYNNIKFLPQ